MTSARLREIERGYIGVPEHVSTATDQVRDVHFRRLDRMYTGAAINEY